MRATIRTLLILVVVSTLLTIIKGQKLIFKKKGRRRQGDDGSSSGKSKGIVHHPAWGGSLSATTPWKDLGELTAAEANHNEQTVYSMVSSSSSSTSTGETYRPSSQSLPITCRIGQRTRNRLCDILSSTKQPTYHHQ